MIHAAIFDMDGVIINSEPIHDKVWKKFFEEQGILVDKNDLDTMRGVPVEVTIKNFMPHIRDESEIKILYDKRADILTQMFQQQTVPLVKGIGEFMVHLRGEDIKIAVATTTKRSIAMQVLEKVGVWKLVDLLVGGDEITKGKPDPEIFLTAAKKLHVVPRDCVVFEDSQAGVEAGLRAKMRVVAMLTSHKKEDFPEVDAYSQDFTTIDLQGF